MFGIISVAFHTLFHFAGLMVYRYHLFDTCSQKRAQLISLRDFYAYFQTLSEILHENSTEIWLVLPMIIL